MPSSAENAPIRILRVIARLNMGGPALHVAYLSEGLAERGYETTLVAGSLARGEGSMAYVAEERGVQVVKLDALSREISPLRDTVAVFRLSRMIRRLRPQILHTHTAKAGAVGRIAALLAGDAAPPIVVHTFHGHVLRGYFGPVTTTAFRLLERWLARRTTRLIAVGPQVRDDLVALGVAPAERFAVVRLGIELEDRTAAGEERAAVRERLGITNDRFVVGWVGRMTGVKRADDVLEAFRLLRVRVPRALLCMIGDGPDREHIEAQAHELGVIRDCLFLGYQHDVAPYYGAMDAFLLPSANEGTPVVVMEALSAGLPVVATRVGGIPDVVAEGEDSFLAAPGDTEQLAAYLVELADDPELRARLGAAGRARVLPRYAVSRLVDDMDDLYRELLAAAG